MNYRSKVLDINNFGKPDKKSMVQHNIIFLPSSPLSMTSCTKKKKKKNHPNFELDVITMSDVNTSTCELNIYTNYNQLFILVFSQSLSTILKLL